MDADGLAATFGVRYAGLGTIDVEIPFDQINGILGELSFARDSMYDRQMMGRGAGLLAPATHAVRPAAIEITVDPITKDRIFRLHFENHAPFSFRVGAVDLAVALAQMAIAVAKSSN